MAVMPAVAAMKQVHERTKKQKEERQDAQQMGAVLGQKKESADCQKTDQDKPASRGPKAASPIWAFVSVPVM
jgi:hypothetical protein